MPTRDEARDTVRDEGFDTGCTLPLKQSDENREHEKTLEYRRSSIRYGI
jgi:hypothetical protein